MEDIIVTKDLTKEYRGYKANHAISMCVKKGSIYGLIGRNGAGKTTFMRMLLGLSKPTCLLYTSWQIPCLYLKS